MHMRGQRARRALRVTGIGVGLALTLAPAATAAKTVAAQDLMLDSYAAAGVPSVTTSGVLARGQFYVVEVSGTLSYYQPALWRFGAPAADPNARAVCGTPEAAPMFPSAVPGGPVGFDAEMAFARPVIARRCASLRLPRTWNNFQVSVGRGFGHPTPVFGRPTAPARSHTYVYLLKGREKPATFRLRDTPANDNYGRLSIRIRRARDADCTAYGARAFQADDRADCRREVS
jgi:hypothetical protein